MQRPKNRLSPETRAQLWIALSAPAMSIVLRGVAELDRMIKDRFRALADVEAKLASRQIALSRLEYSEVDPDVGAEPDPGAGCRCSLAGDGSAPSCPREACPVHGIVAATETWARSGGA